MQAGIVKNTGSVLIEVIEAGAAPIQLEVTNLVVTSGLAHIAERLIGSPAAMSHMAIGSNGNAPALWNTGLYAETGRVAFESAPTRSGNATTYIATFPQNVATGTVAELGIFNSAGAMLARTVFPAAQTKESYASIRVTWVITQS